MKKIILSLWCIIFIASLLTIAIYAVDTDFKTTELPKEEWNDGWSNIRFRKAGDLNKIKGAIKSFDISESGEILLCLENNYILILDNDGNRLKAFAYNSAGSSLAAWKGENILLFFWRGYLLVEISTDGQLLNMKEIDHSDVNNNDMLRKWQSTTQIESNGYTYIAENEGLFADMLSGNTHSKLTRIDVNGNSKTLYGSNNTQTSKVAVTVFIILLVNIIAPLATVIVVIKIRNKRKNKVRSLRG